MVIRFEKTKFKVWSNCYLKSYLLCSQPLSKSIKSSNLNLGPHLFFFLLIIFSFLLFTLCCVQALLFHFGVSRIWRFLSKMSMWIFNYIFVGGLCSHMYSISNNHVAKYKITLANTHVVNVFISQLFSF